MSMLTKLLFLQYMEIHTNVNKIYYELSTKHQIQRVQIQVHLNVKAIKWKVYQESLSYSFLKIEFGPYNNMQLENSRVKFKAIF